MQWKEGEDKDIYYDASDMSEDEDEYEDEGNNNIQVSEFDDDKSYVPLVEEEVKRS